jgi:hypothetical protein
MVGFFETKSYWRIPMVIPRVAAPCTDYHVVHDIIVFCCLSYDNVDLVYVVGDTAILGGEVHRYASAKILAEI